ncbi:MAG: aminotransferase class I/II-fold pyridoxal phosphate-dependent enzyme [Flavobacteriaceae bacterium]|nr:aminotransferase class I/II-fold pyridoxal phosphate-dependent enzyme [Flavobacteriaceae bacterium]
MKHSFRNDYSEGCHPKILEALFANNDSQQNGYGEDEFCRKAETLILEKCKSSNSKVHFVSGGTFANLLVISAVLKPYESVISADSGHINSNETGAVEHAGHKIHSVFSENGKLYPEQISEVLKIHTNFPHQVKPKLVYISNATELGTVYTKKELKNLYEFCKKNRLFLFMDGARLGQAIASENGDLSLEDCAKFTDVFYIGGTKNGALFGEAIVVNNPEILEDIRFHIKQKGGLLAKGRVLGIQFLTLFQDDLYFNLAKHANLQMKKIKNKFEESGFRFLTETYSNQLFPILNQKQIQTLQSEFEFYEWKKIDEHFSAIRLITSWKTNDETVEKFIRMVSGL